MARRLKEREDREREEKARLQEEEKENLALREKQDDERRPVQANPKLPPGVLTPLLTRHRDLDDELRTRLAELEER